MYKKAAKDTCLVLQLAVGLLLSMSTGALGRHGSEETWKTMETEETWETMETDTSVYTFAFAGNNPPFEFVDETSQTLMGFSVDVVQEVCRHMDKRCQWIVLRDSSDCWDADKSYSRGLNGRWFHACVGWEQTKPRSLVYSFRGQYEPEAASRLYVRQRSSIDSVQTAIRGGSAYRVGFVTGSWLSSTCLRQQLNWDIDSNEIIEYNTQARVQQALESGQIDVALLEESLITERTQIRALGELDEAIRCTQAGRTHSLSVRKDMAHMFDWYDEGLEKLKADGTYKQICDRARVAYGDPWCAIV